MGVAQFRGAALHKRNQWRRELDESKIDMGLMDPFSQEMLDHSLIAAVDENSHKAVREMIDMGANPNVVENGEPLLHAAIRKGSLKTVIALLQTGANPHTLDAAGRSARDVSQETSSLRIRTILKLWDVRATVGGNSQSDETGDIRKAS